MSLSKICWLLLLSSICQFSLLLVSSTALILSVPRVKSLIFKSCWYPGDFFWKISNRKKLLRYDFYLTSCRLKLSQTVEEIHFFPHIFIKFIFLHYWRLKCDQWNNLWKYWRIKGRRKITQSISLFTDYRCLYVDAFPSDLFFFVFSITVIVEVQSVTWRGVMVYFFPVSVRSPSGFHWVSAQSGVPTLPQP